MSYIPGLEGVVVGETAVSHVEGNLGRLSYRGRLIEDVVAMDYLEAAWLVLFGRQPDGHELTEFDGFLSRHGALSDADLDLITRIPTTLHPMKALQAVIPLLTHERASFCVGDTNLDDEAVTGLQIIAKYPSVIAAIRAGRSEFADTGRFTTQHDYLERFMLMYTGSIPGPREMEVLKVVQLLQMDHSFNAGTFASRVIGSTLAPVTAVLSGAVGALSGVLHGGADEGRHLKWQEK